MRRYMFSLFILVAFILGLYFGSIAQAIPTGQADCAENTHNVNTTLAVDPDISVTVNNGNVSRLCIFQVSAENSANSTGDWITLGFKIDTTSCKLNRDTATNGPEFFHVNTGDSRTTADTIIATRNLSAGSHTVRPCYKSNIGTGAVAFRCMIVECQTQ
jgi:hypothetical protein